MMVKVKLCGITNADDAALCVAEGADALGFIFVEKSPRAVTPEIAAQIVKLMPPSVMSVGVFADASLAEIERIVALVGLDAVQLHGKEAPAYCALLKSRVKVIKVFFPKDESILADMRRYAAAVDMMLIDTPFERKNSADESVHTADLVSRIMSEFRWCIYSGGVTLENIDDVLKTLPYMIDIARGSEIAPGKKDPAKVKQLIAKIKGHKGTS